MPDAEVNIGVRITQQATEHHTVVHHTVHDTVAQSNTDVYSTFRSFGYLLDCKGTQPANKASRMACRDAS